MSFDMVWLNPKGEEGGNFLVQMISTYLLSRRGRRVGVGALWQGTDRLHFTGEKELKGIIITLLTD